MVLPHYNTGCGKCATLFIVFVEDMRGDWTHSGLLYICL